MNRLAMSRSAAGLLRALLSRCGEERDRVLLSEQRSADWQSLTFVGERHQLRFHILGPGAAIVLERLTSGLADAEFAIPGQIVADVAVHGSPVHHPDGSISVEIEALTIAE